MTHLLRYSVFLLLLCAGTSLAMGQAAVKQLPDDAKVAQLEAAADDVLSAKMDAYSQKMGFADVISNFTPTGNPEVDLPAYTAAKLDWIASHSAEYADMVMPSIMDRPSGVVRVNSHPAAQPE